MRRAAKRDTNEEAIVQALRQLGASVERLNGTPGLPDLLVGYRGANWLFEVKTPNGKETPDQIAWRLTWDGSYWVIRSIDDALTVLGLRS